MQDEIKDFNTGDWNTGDWNTGNFNAGIRNTGHRNTGGHNTGDFNTGNWNTGEFNTGNYSNGVFCTKTPEIMIFNQPSRMTLPDFYRSRYWDAICSSDFPLTEWVSYTEQEIGEDEQKRTVGGYLKTRTYQEACKIWWENMTEENRNIIQDLPNFDAAIFEEITGICVD